MRKFLITLTIFFTLAIPAFAQSVAVSADEYDKIKIAALYQNLNVASQNLPGVNLSVDYKITGFGRWCLGAVVDGAFQHDTNKVVDRYQILGGPQVSYLVGDRISVFGRGLFGATRFDQQSVRLKDFSRVTVGVGGGLDIHFGHFFVRPAQFDFQFIDERPVRYTRFGAGGGYRF